MQLTLTPEQEAHLSRLAAQAGRSVDEVAHEALNLYLANQQRLKGEATLLFDEADALFGKRTEVKDSHDRYANQDDDSSKRP
ncbi:MAG TPA: hypothetical protein VL346_08740 [Acidobacteriaceae bacterium]|nr:hypothetical protein [Acidobacteriaceae bacterium]